MEYRTHTGAPVSHVLEVWLSFNEPLSPAEAKALSPWPMHPECFDEREVRMLHLSGELPGGFAETLLGWLRSGRVRFAEFGLRPVALFPDGPVRLPWRRNRGLEPDELSGLVIQPGLRYQVPRPRTMRA